MTAAARPDTSAAADDPTRSGGPEPRGIPTPPVPSTDAGPIRRAGSPTSEALSPPGGTVTRRRTAFRRVVVLLGLVAGSLVLSVAGATPASAHVQILSSTPADGSRMAAAPVRITVRLSEDIGIQPDSLHVVDQRGTRVDNGPVFQPGEAADVLAIRLRPNLPDGSYLVEYAFISADTHPVRGSFAFVVGNGPLETASGAVSASSGTNSTVNMLSTTFRWLSFCGVILLGGLVFVVVCRPEGRADRRVRRLVFAGCVVSAVSAVAALLLQGPYVAGQGVSSTFSGKLLHATLGVPYGKLLLLRVAAAGALAWLARGLLQPADRMSERLRSRWENLTLVSGFVVLLSFSAAGHAIAVPAPFFSVTADLAHFGAITVWIGGLVQLIVFLWRPGPEEDPAGVLTRFSPLATAALGVVVVSGTYLSLRTVPSVSALWSTHYGVLLLLKLAGFAGMLALANISRLAVRRGIVATSTEATRRRLSRSSIGNAALLPGTAAEQAILPPPALRRIRLAIGAEVAIATVVLALAAMLSSLAPTT